MLQHIEQKSGDDLFNNLIKERFNGGIKLWLVNQLSNLRKQYSDLLSVGEYIPLKAEGIYKENIIAFARKEGDNMLIIAAALHTAIISEEQQKAVWQIDWKDTRLLLPKNTGEWSAVLTNESKQFKASVEIKELFARLPFCILKGQASQTERGAGLLMHISSLPSKFGIGDMGPEAKNFVDALKRSGQKFWQLLPLNPTEEGQGHSPYSSISSKAGNSLFISPELLQKEGFLTSEELQQATMSEETKIHYKEATRVKEELLDKAWEHFQNFNDAKGQTEFEAFLKEEKEWLDDFALYVVLKRSITESRGSNGKKLFEINNQRLLIK